MTDHCFSDEAIAYYAARAQGGFGLLITEFLCVDETGLGCDTEIGIWNDRFIPSLARLTEAIHSKEGRIFAQLHHQGILAVCSDIHTQPVGPSAIMSLSSMDPPRELSNAEVYALAGRFVDAAERAQKAGFDGVEIHAAHGYLLCQFLSTYFNKRSDEFGGSYENRFRMIRLIIAGIRERCGASYPISFRFSTDNFLDGGAIPHDSLIYAKLAEQAGVDYIHVSTGGAGGNVVTPYTYRPGFNIENIAKIKQNVSVPVIGVGRINEPALADLYVQMGLLDMVSLGRQSICDPNFPNKARDGCAQEIIPCVGCLQRCFFTPGYDETDTGISCIKIWCFSSPKFGRRQRKHYLHRVCAVVRRLCCAGTHKHMAWCVQICTDRTQTGGCFQWHTSYTAFFGILLKRLQDFRNSFRYALFLLLYWGIS